jgi:hypothetical protein
MREDDDRTRFVRGRQAAVRNARVAASFRYHVGVLRYCVRLLSLLTKLENSRYRSAM